MEIICAGLVFYVIVGRDQNDTISCSKFETSCMA